MNGPINSYSMAEIGNGADGRVEGCFPRLRRMMIAAALLFLAIDPAWAGNVDSMGWNPAVQYGKLVDSRDGQEYRTVKIGKGWWMAQNLNFAMDSSWCYERRPADCAKYGRLYQWTAASMACPDGWHLPTGKEWGYILGRLDTARVMAKLISAKDWGMGDSAQRNPIAALLDLGRPVPPKYARNVERMKVEWIADDTLGFRALPAGIRSRGNGEPAEALMLTQDTRTRTFGAEFGLQGSFAYFWAMTDFDGFYTWNTDYTRVLSVISRIPVLEKYGFSVRCVQD